jgi:hypothetical protein
MRDKHHQVTDQVVRDHVRQDSKGVLFLLVFLSDCVSVFLKKIALLLYLEFGDRSLDLIVSCEINENVFRGAEVEDEDDEKGRS